MVGSKGGAWLGVGLAAAGLGVLLWAAYGRRPPTAGAGFPPLPPRSAVGVAFEDFVGSEGCADADCHGAIYRAWSASTHARAGGDPDPDFIIAAFDGAPMRFRDAVVTPERMADGGYAFIVEHDGWPRRVLRVDGVVGRGHLVGGGTQGFFSRFPDGTVRYLPFDYHADARLWFCDTWERAGGGWVPITAQLSLADCGDWPPTRVMGTGAGQVSCQECHGSQIQGRFVGGAEPYQTRWTTLQVNCESCHGPGREHVEWARVDSLRDSVDVGYPALATQSTDEALSVCFRCHALKKELGDSDYLPGKPLREHYSVGFAQLGDRPYFPDGRVRTFAYQETHLASDCYLSGSMKCEDCHEPHGQGYRDNHGRPLEGRFSDGQCLGCHPSKADRIEEHTYHKRGSPGSVCVSCHMPYLQEPAIGRQLRYARSDHTIPIPRPALDSGLGLQDACSSCHQELSVAELEAQVSRWYGRIKPLKAPVAALMEAPEGQSRLDAARRLLLPDAAHPPAQIAGLVRVLEDHLVPDMGDLEPEVEERLRGLAGSTDLDLRSLALATLHLTRGEDPAVGRFLRERVRAEGSTERALRERWASALGYLGDLYRKRERPRAALAAYRKGLEVLPGDARLLGGAGLAYALGGSPAAAADHLRRSLASDSLQPLALVDLGQVYASMGDPDRARQSLEQALALDPYAPTAHLNLGNVYFAEGRLEEAVAFYRRAGELNPGLLPAHLGLALAELRLGRPGEAAAAARRALQFDPGSNMAGRLLRQAEGAR